MCVQVSVALGQGPQAGPYEHGNYSSDFLNSPDSLTTLAPTSFSTCTLRRGVHLFNFFFNYVALKWMTNAGCVLRRYGKKREKFLN
jgi:hypothetical protein